MIITSSLVIKKCIVGTLSLGLAGSGTNKFSALTLNREIRNPLRYLLINCNRFQRILSRDVIPAE